MNAFIVIACFLFGFSASQEITSTECNVSKGCFRSPSDCTSSSNCDFMVTYKLNKAANTVSFELSSKAGNWVALGLSNTQSMSGTAGEMCIFGRSDELLQGFLSTSYATPKMFSLDGNPSIVFEGLTNVDGALVCRFTRTINSSTAYQAGLNKKFFFIVASGDTRPTTDIPSYHKTSRTYSSTKYNVAFPILPVQANTTTQPIANNTTTQSSNTTAPTVPANSTTVMPSAEPLATSTHSNSSVAPSAEPETTSSAFSTTENPDDDSGSGMIAPTTFVTVACLIFARMSS